MVYGKGDTWAETWRKWGRQPNGYLRKPHVVKRKGSINAEMEVGLVCVGETPGGKWASRGRWRSERWRGERLDGDGLALCVRVCVSGDGGGLRVHKVRRHSLSGTWEGRWALRVSTSLNCPQCLSHLTLVPALERALALIPRESGSFWRVCNRKVAWWTLQFIRSTLATVLKARIE